MGKNRSRRQAQREAAQSAAQTAVADPKPVTSYGTTNPDLAALATIVYDATTLMPNLDQFVNRPGTEGYDPDKDVMIAGFRHGSTVVTGDMRKKFPEVKTVNDLTPYHFLSDPETEMRPTGGTKPPWGTALLDLSYSIAEYAVLPPIAIWKAGDWLINLYDDLNFAYEELSKTIRDKIEAAVAGAAKFSFPEELWGYYVVSGEGTPGNNYYRVYICPTAISHSPAPRHPLMWSKDDFDVRSYSTGGGWSGSSQGFGSASKSTTDNSLPAGVRVKCQGCGHWYKVDDLAGHAKVCSATNGGDADYAVMCCSECGCRTLDEASTPKQGYPKHTEKPEAEKEVKA